MKFYYSDGCWTLPLVFPVLIYYNKSKYNVQLMIHKAAANGGVFYFGLESVLSAQGLCILLWLLLRVHNNSICMEKILTSSLSCCMGESILQLANHIWKQMFIAEAKICPSCTLVLHLFSLLQKIRANTVRYSRLDDFLTNNTILQLYSYNDKDIKMSWWRH